MLITCPVADKWRQGNAPTGCDDPEHEGYTSTRAMHIPTRRDSISITFRFCAVLAFPRHACSDKVYRINAIDEVESQ